jgi:hypothetical protein
MFEHMKKGSISCMQAPQALRHRQSKQQQIAALRHMHTISVPAVFSVHPAQDICSVKQVQA